MTVQTSMDNRISDLISLNDQLKQVFQPLKDEYDNINVIEYRGSALVNILRFEENDEQPHDGMLMFVYRYSDETDSFTLECHMEVNFRTVEDNNDRYKFPADEEDPQPLAFAEKKVEQFKQVYEDPPELMF